MNEIQKLLGEPLTEEGAGSLLSLVFGTRFAAFAHGGVDRKELCEVTRLGQIRCDEATEKRVEVLLVRVTGSLALRRNRVGLRKIVDKYYSAADSVAGLLAFYYKEGESSWRLSYAYKRAALDEKGEIARVATDLHRCSYLLGPGENTHTPALRLQTLSGAVAARMGVARVGRTRVGDNLGHLYLLDIEKAFSVEAVSEKLFADYRIFYDRFAEELAMPVNRALFGLPARGDFNPRSPEAKPLRDFAKKLMGRLVFLKFLEKKGWLGASDYAAQDGRRDFLLDLFKTYRKDFYVEALVPLFFETLNRPRKGDLFSLTGSKVPYLNGGLFEADYDIEGVNRKIRLSGGLFEELLKFFDQYNFTVDEHDEGDEEIGVDPEMLGRIFERLIEDNEKDMNGTIYTPYAVVEFMCRNSLHLHLCRALGCEREDEKGAALKRLLTEHDVGGLGKAEQKKVEAAARDLKVLDPAVGSGAFPLGMLKELVALRETLAEASGQILARDELKRQIIRTSLYGVDLDPGAVDIARLRLFLALVVDATEPEPLPNLDFKIMQGDSLAEGWDDIPIVFDAAEYRRHSVKESDGLFETGEMERLNKRKRKSASQILKESGEDVLALLDSYYDPSGSPEKKRESRETIEALELYTVRQALESDLAQKKELRRKAEEKKRMDPKPSTLKVLAKTEEAVRLCESRLVSFDSLESGSLRDKPWFLWHYYFHDAFESGGFDIIIGNPPYRANQANENDQAKNKAYPLIDARIKETFVAKSKAQKTKCYDPFSRFYRLAMDFVICGKKNSMVAFITNYACIVKDSFDGFRRDVKECFNQALVINLKGDAHPSGELRKKNGGNIFNDSVRVGIAISIFEKRELRDVFNLLYGEVDDYTSYDEKVSYIKSNPSLVSVTPDVNDNWIGFGGSDFSGLVPICSKEAKMGRAGEGTIFKIFSLGICTNRDDWAYDIDETELSRKIRFFIKVYNDDVGRYTGQKKIAGFVSRSIKYTSELEASAMKGITLSFVESNICKSLYRPWCYLKTYFDENITHRQYKIPLLLDKEGNFIICTSGPKSTKPFQLIGTEAMPNLDTLEKTHCFAIYCYANRVREENITDWSLSLFRDHYKDTSITKEDIFHYVYAVLHNPAYRAKYALDLKRYYPRVPLYKEFRKWAGWGKRLMEIHVDFEKQDEAAGIVEFPGDGKERKCHAADYVKDAEGHRSYTGSVRFSDGSLLKGIPPKAFDYRLGNKSAIEWVLDQYSEKHWPSDEEIAAGKAKPLREDEKVLRDKFNAYRFADYKEKVISLIKRLVTISLETLDIQEKMAKEEDHGMDLRALYDKTQVVEEGVDTDMAAERGE